MVDLILSSHGLVAYLVVFGVLVASSLGLPVPEDLTLIVAGIISNHEQVNLWLMAGICYLGILAGDLLIYRVGWLAGPALFRKKWFRRHLTTKRLHLIRENLHKRTILTILVARHLFYIRTATFLMCGAVRLPFARFFLIDACAALITVPVMMGIGFLFAHHYELIMAYMRQIKIGLVVVGVILLTYVVIRYRRKSTDPEDDDDPSLPEADTHEVTDTDANG
jgi:membrane protein DedA with SNARE-associated domain